jgi:hypothetical protein
MKKAIISLLMMEVIEGVVIQQEFIDNVTQILAAAAEEDLNEQGCNPCYNTSNTKNNHYGYTKGTSQKIGSHAPHGAYTSKWANQSPPYGAPIENDANVIARNKKLGGAASMAETDCEADAECNPSYNSSLHPNNHYGFKGKVSAAIGANVPNAAYTSKWANQSPAFGKAIATDADIKARNAKVGGAPSLA